MASDQYSRADVGTRGLACPFAKSDPERYMNVEACKTIEGFKEPRFLLCVQSNVLSREGAVSPLVSS